MQSPQRYYGCFFILTLSLTTLFPCCLDAQIVYEANLPQLPVKYYDHDLLINEAYAGNPDAEFWYGTEFQDSGRPEMAAKWFEAAVAKGHPQAMHNLARLYEDGKGVPKDLRRAFKLNLQSAKKGWSHAQQEIAVCYDEGRGVEPDLKEAVRWCELSEKSGYGHASAQLAWWYRFGKEFIQKDCVKAAEKYMLAARHGHFHSAHQLAWMYWHGEGIMRDFQKAEKWFRAGAYDGNPVCLKDLALFLAACPDDPFSNESQRKPEEAIALIREAIAAVKPDINFKYHTIYSYALSHCQRWDDAIAQVDIAIKSIEHDTAKTEAERQNIKDNLQRLQDQYRKRIPWVETLPVRTFYGPAPSGDDILKNKAWPQVGLQTEPPRIEGRQWSDRLKATLRELPKLAGTPTIFDLAAPAGFAFFVNAPRLPAQKSEVDLLIQKTESGDAVAAFTLAALLLSDPTDKDKQDLGLELLQQLADLNQPDACNLLGWLHYKNRWFPRDKQKALSLFLVAANQLHADGQCSAAHAYMHGFTGAVLLKEGVRLYRRAADKNHAGAKVKLAEHLLVGSGAQQNLDECVTLLKETASHNYAPAQLRLGWLYHLGMGVRQDQEEAFSLFSKAAAQGEANAEVELGRLLQKQNEDEPTLHKAAGLFLKAAQQLNYAGIRQMADCYLEGRGVPVDYRRAIAWLRICFLSKQMRDHARLAMALALCPDPKLRDPREAVEIVAKAIKQLSADNVPEGPTILQAAAAAYASAGDFGKAAEHETRAGQAIRAMIPTDSNFTETDAEKSNRLLIRYRQGRRIVATPPLPKSNSLPLPDTVLEDFDKLAERMMSAD